MFVQTLLLLILLYAAAPSFGSAASSVDSGLSTGEKEVLHWVLYEASQEGLTLEAKHYLKNHSLTENSASVEAYLTEYVPQYTSGLDTEIFFQEMILKNGFESLFLVYLDDLNSNQIETFVSRASTSERTHTITEHYLNDSLDEVTFTEEDLHIGLLLFDHPNYHRNLSEEIENLHASWLSRSNRYTEMENALIANYFIRAFRVNQNFNKLLESYKKNNLEVLPPLLFNIDTYSFLYSALLERGYFETLLTSVRENLKTEIQSHFGSPDRNADLYLTYAIALMQVGNIQEALKALEDLGNLIEDDATNLERYYPFYFNDLGVVYHRLGRYNEYLDLQLQALDYAREFNNQEAKLHYLNNLYRFYRANDNWEQAEYYLDMGMEVAQEAPHEEYAEIVLATAVYYRDYKRNYTKATSYFEEALELAKESEELVSITHVKTDWAAMLREQQEYDAAADLHATVMELTEQAGSRRSWLDAVSRYTEIRMDQDHIDETSAYLDTLRQENISEYDFRFQLRINNTLARALKMENDLTAARDKMEPFISEALGRVQNSSDYQTGRASLPPVKENAFRLYASLLYEKAAHAPLLTFLDRLNNLSQADFHNHHLLKSEVLSEEELIYDQELTQMIDELRTRLRTADEDERAELNEMLLQAENEKNQLRHKIHDQAAFEEADISAVQRSLDRNEMILNYRMIDNRMYVHAIYQDEIRADVVDFEDVEILEIEQRIDQMHEGETDLKFLRELYTRLLDPEWFENVDHLEVVPDHFMYYIPHETLPVTEPQHSGAYGSTRYLIEDIVINYRHALNEWHKTGLRRNFPGWTNEIVAMGVTRTQDSESVLEPSKSLPALPFASKEINDIKTFYSRHQSCRLFLDEEANYDNFVSTAHSGRILHLATHGEVSPHDPLFSVIYLGGDQADEQSHIFAYELFEMNLQNELVVLSSCESGAGTYVKGGGIAGLSRAFRFAGARSMATNLWPVRDETAARLSADFHKHLQQGYSKDEALREAKLDYLNNRNSNPYWWAAMTLYGDPSPLYRTSSSRQVALSLLLLWMISLVAVGYLKSRNAIPEN